MIQQHGTQKSAEINTRIGQGAIAAGHKVLNAFINQRHNHPETDIKGAVILNWSP